MQERLAQQQKATAEERTYLKEIISRMDAQLGEQQRQLEKVTVKSNRSRLATRSTKSAIKRRLRFRYPLELRKT